MKTFKHKEQSKIEVGDQVTLLGWDMFYEVVSVNSAKDEFFLRNSVGHFIGPYYLEKHRWKIIRAGGGRIEDL